MTQVSGELDPAILTALIAAYPLPTIGFDDQLRVTIWNSAAERMLGWTAAEVLGRRNPSIPVDLLPTYEATLRAAFQGENLVNAPTYRLRRDGSRVNILLSTATAHTLAGTAGVAVYVDLGEFDREASFHLPVVVWTTDTNLEITTIRSGGIPEKELRARQDVAAMTLALRGQTARYSFVLDGRTFDVRVDPLRTDNGIVRGTVAVAFDVTERERTEAAIRASREELRRLTAHMSDAEEEQRRRIAREIHDEMGQRLTALHLELHLLRRASGGAVSIERIDSMDRLIHDAAETVRRVASDLRPSMLDDFGLSAAIENELVQLQRRTGIEYDLSFPDLDPPLDRNAKTALFRMVQEMLTNVVRHSGATRLSMSMSVADDGIELRLHDDGRGITAAEVTSERSLGLVGIRERAHALGGYVEFDGSPGAGTRVTVRLPSRL